MEQAPLQDPARLVRGLMRLGGVVAMGAGLHTALAGARSVPGFGAGPADARLDSELRFFGPFYSAFGVHLWRSAGRAGDEPGELQRAAAVVFAAGVARAAGWRLAGRPSPPQIGLLAIELAAPPLVLALQARAGRAPAP